VRIDLHTHSNRSDGTEPPAAVVRAARDAGVDVLALTDHDTTVGWAEAAQAAGELGVAFVPGLEISCAYAGYGVHLLGYLPDPTYPPLVEELDRVLRGRNGRLPAVLEKLNALGIPVEVDEVRELAGDAAALGRPHIADALVAHGVVGSRGEAFDRFLGPRGPAYVKRYAADLEEMIGLLDAAGGVSVIAHPWAARHNHDALDHAGLARLREVGLTGIEVDHEDHGDDARTALRALADELDLVATGSSDYHGLGKRGHRLGCNTTDPEQLDRLLARADEAAARSGRRTPDVVGSVAR
jgi:predicted metal-dependent phosphoesterase TrpH